jgi:hypothetical protein
MAKAHITTKDGTTIDLEGTADEVAAWMVKFGLMNQPSAPAATHGAPRRGAAAVESRSVPKTKTTAKGGGKKTITATTLLAELIENDFFKKPQVVGGIIAEMKQRGHYFSDSGVGVPLLRAVRKRSLRRIKGKDGAWTYVV